MPDCLNKKIDQLSTILAPYGARKLSTNELSKFNGKYVCAWELVTDLEFSNEPIVLQLRYKTLSQFDIPDVFISSPKIDVCQLHTWKKMASYVFGLTVISSIIMI